MPAKKTAALLTSDRHTARMAEREASEAALALKKRLSVKPPMVLDGYPVAQECWKYHIRLYDQLAGVIITPFDRDLLVEYCLGQAYLAELRHLRKLAMEKHRYELYVSVDQRMDRKGARLDTVRQQLYLTPRSRAGVAPIVKEKEEDDPMDRLLDGYSWNEVVKMNSPETSNG